MHSVLEARLNPVTEARRMVGGHTRVLIHMKGFDSVPFDRQSDQSLNKRDLRVSGGDNHSRSATLLDRVGDHFSGDVRGRSTQCSTRAIHLNMRLSGTKGLQTAFL